MGSSLKEPVLWDPNAECTKRDNPRWVPFFGWYLGPLVTRDPRPPRVDGWIGFSSPWPIGVVI